jgi:hypothetical protein
MIFFKVNHLTLISFIFNGGVNNMFLSQPGTKIKIKELLYQN